ncbi:hypothetical protein Sjap_000417 [Stephania japonica]|uniref:O-methyltransferase C-terminal domain-containing protein n=1 Tax=Stephania japonica TaxID=461633 RepID=A0AAP0KI08_9MAGN
MQGGGEKEKRSSEIDGPLTIPIPFRDKQREIHAKFQPCPQIIRCNLPDLIKTSAAAAIAGLPEFDVKAFTKSILFGLDSVAWRSLSRWLKGADGSTPFEGAHGKSAWKFVLENPDICNMFNEAMAEDSRVISSVLVIKCKDIFQGLTSLVDVGGGIGVMARAVAEAFPHIKCSVLDLPHVVAACEGSDNLEFVAGDMFQAIPYADALLLKWVLHDWSDEDCLKILRRCREAIVSKEKGGKVIIIDIVLDPNGGTHESVELQLFFDLQLMVNVNGKQRTESEWKKLFTESGFTSCTITPVLGFRSVIEVVP